MLLVILFSLIFVASAQKGGAPEAQCASSAEETAFGMANTLHYIGDPKAIIVEYDEEINQRCNQVKDVFNKGLKYTKCLKGSQTKRYFHDLLTNFNVYFIKQCKSEEWRDKFLKFGRCLVRSEKAREVHQCGYKLHDALKYALQKAQAKDLVTFACCIPSGLNDCIYDKLEKECGKETAELAYETIYWGPVQPTFDKTCPGDNSYESCMKKIPKLMKEMDKIINSNLTLTPRNFPKMLLQIFRKASLSFSPRQRNSIRN